MSAALHQIIVIFVPMIAGFLLRKLKIMTEGGTKELTAVVLNVCLPGMLFSTILSTSVQMDTGGVLFYLAISTGMFLLSILCGKLFTLVTRTPKADRGVYEFALLAGNVGYMGIPVCLAVFGPDCGIYAALINIPFTLLCFSLGIALLAGKASFRRILNPSFLTSVVAVLLYLFRIPVPKILNDAASFLGQATSPCAMLVIGSTLAAVPFREIFTEWRFLPFLAVRLFGIAALTWLLVGLLPVDPIGKAVLVLMAAMPTATNATMLSSLYGGNTELSAKLIFLSTVVSIVSMPLWGAFLT